MLFSVHTLHTTLHSQGAIGMTNQTTPSAMLGMNIGREHIHCVLFHEGKLRSTIIGNSSDGFADLMAWLRAHAVHRVHAFCDSMAQRWQAVADFMRFAGHHVSVLDEQQVLAVATALSCLNEEKLAAAA
jgi:hypothetical protein